jgi:LPXTG-motif cell wall-anchored protein
MLNRPSEIEVDDFNNFVNRPKTLEVDSNEFDSFLGKKAKARRQARRDAKNGVTTDSNPAIDPALSGALPTADIKKPNTTTSTTTTTGDVSTKSTDATTGEASTGFTTKKGLLIGAGVVALIAGYWFFVRKKK